MKKSQLYSTEEITLAISMWQESGLSQTAFCKREGIARSTFQHWMKRRGLAGIRPKGKKTRPAQSFIPVSVSKEVPVSAPAPALAELELVYPNGVRVQCPAGMDIEQFKQLVTLF